MNPYDEINLLIEQLCAEWGGVNISCDEDGCTVSDPGGNRGYDGDTLLEALRAAVQKVSP